MTEPEKIKYTKAEVVDIAMGLGKLLLKNGAETTRVEDSITRFCKNCGVNDLNVYVTPTGIILGDEETNGVMVMCRIRFRTINLTRISQANEFSYNFLEKNWTYEEAMEWLNGMLVAEPTYNKWILCLVSGIASGCFSLLLGGNVADFTAAFFVGGLAMVLLKLLAGYRPSAFWENVLAGAAIGALATFSCYICPDCTMEKITVGALMPFLPGTAFTNSLRDYMAGDLVSGNCRSAEALLFAISLAIGLAISLKLCFLWGGILWR